MEHDDLMLNIARPTKSASQGHSTLENKKEKYSITFKKNRDNQRKHSSSAFNYNLLPTS